MVAAVIHPKALVESDRIGDGTAIYAFAHVMPNVVIGRNCKVGDHAFLESGVTLGDNVTVKNGVSIWQHVHIADNVFVGPHAAFTNDRYPRRAEVWEPVPTWVEEGVSIGANATVVCGVRLGRRCLVAAGAVVTRDVLPHAMVTGNPAAHQGWVCHCGRPLKLLAEEAACGHCNRRYTPAGTGIAERA
jgi:UDP-2-acetamido-3-amino-2,3-dideoxy-glucuronate N-acetyltransferase